jgi:hypothetical protein
MSARGAYGAGGRRHQCSDSPKTAEPQQACRRVDSLIRPRHLGRTNLVCVSYLAQTRKPARATIYSPECVDGAATADSWLSFLGRCGISPDQVRSSGHIQPIGTLHRVSDAKSPGRTRFDSFERDAGELAREHKEGPKTMPLIQLLEVLIVVGVLLWLVNRFIPMQGSIKSILNGVVVIAVVLWLLNLFGLFHSLSRIHIGT